MTRSIKAITGLTISVYNSSCAHTCRYCSIGDRKFLSVSTDRYVRLFDRFFDWKAANGLIDMKIGTYFNGPAFNYDIESLPRLIALWKRMGYHTRVIMQGGLRILPDDQMREWLRARQALGYQSVAVTLAGHGPVHDRWNGRRGDFDFVVRTQQIAKDLGMELQQGFFVSKSTLPLLDEAVAILDKRLGGPPAYRYARLFMSAGHGGHHESDRLLEVDRERIPAWIRDFIKPENMRSERELIGELKARPPSDDVETSLHLHIDDSNIEKIEATPCAQIFDDLEHRTRALFTAMPSVAELIDKVADPDGRRLYPFAFDLERVWMDRYLDKYPLELDWQLSPPHVGRYISRRPPHLAPISRYMPAQDQVH